jgi:HSP20 family protein
MFIVPVSRRAFPVSRGLDRLFDDAFDRFFTAPVAIANDAPPARRPALDVSETERQYVVTLDVPGIKREDIQVSIEGRHVSIVAESKTEATTEAAAADEAKPEAAKPEAAADAAPAERVILRERAFASYARSFTLPAEIDQSESQARLENGVLTLTLTKRSANAARLTVN